MPTNIKAVLGILALGIAGSGLVIWFFYFQSPSPSSEPADTSFGSGDSRNSTSVVPTDTQNGTLPAANNGTAASASKIFKITDGPVAGATLIDTVRPTSTIARYTLANNGHTFDYLLDSSGVVARPVSNTTIPGIAEVVWSEGGRGALLRYVDDGVLKTAHLSLPAPNATSSAARLQFLPSGIARLAVSPDGNNIAYLVTTSSGADGYIARADGANTEKIFSVPLSQVDIAWPAPNVILVQSAPSAGAGGVVFTVNASTGAIAPLMHAEGLTVTANRDFSRVIYQTYSATTRSTYVQSTATGLSRPLSFTPVPELCAWSMATSSVVYCAAPATYVAPNYLDLLHLGVDSTSMSLLAYNLQTGQSGILTVPGGSDGGVAGEIAELSVSPSEKYLLFIREGDRSLWGVRLY